MKLTKRAKREPLRTFLEMAEEFGITPHQLNGYIMAHQPAPEPLCQHRSSWYGPRYTYYSPTEMRRWWRGVLEAKKA